MSKLNPAAGMANYQKYFDTISATNGGDEEVWAKNTAIEGRTVILQIKSANGETIKLPNIEPGLPVCLSAEDATFADLRAAGELKRLVNRGALKLVTSDEANAAYAKRAQLMNMTPQELLNSRNKEKPQFVVDEAPLSLEEREETAPPMPVVSSRVQQICARVAADLRPADREPVTSIMPDLYDYEDSMTTEDLDYVRANGFYPAAKNWALKVLEKRAELEE